MSSNNNMSLSNKKAEEIEAERVEKIRNDHRLLCLMYQFEVIREEDSDTILGFADINRVQMNLHGKETSHADLCLRNYLSYPELYASDTPVKGCKCKTVLKFTKSEQQVALADVPPHVHDIRERNLRLFDVAHRNYRKALALHV